MARQEIISTGKISLLTVREIVHPVHIPSPDTVIISPCFNSSINVRPFVCVPLDDPPRIQVTATPFFNKENLTPDPNKLFNTKNKTNQKNQKRFKKHCCGFIYLKLCYKLSYSKHKTSTLSESIQHENLSLLQNMSNEYIYALFQLSSMFSGWGEEALLQRLNCCLYVLKSFNHSKKYWLYVSDELTV